jgi:acyl-coenzyme A thioesterase PaaI-like protein
MSPTELLVSLSDTGARIVAEDDTHAVIAIRVGKATLQNFLQLHGHFIAALSDLGPKRPNRD